MLTSDIFTARQITGMLPSENAAHLLQRAQDAIEHGLGNLLEIPGFEPVPYTIDDFMADTWCGEISWSNDRKQAQPPRDLVLKALMKDPHFEGINAAFEAKFGIKFWDPSFDEQV